MSNGNSGYSKMKCYNKMTKQFVGFIGTHGNSVSLVTDVADAADVKWEPHDNDLYLAKETTPNDRYLAVGERDYAAWDLWTNLHLEPVVLNSDGTISLKNKPNIKLYGPTRSLGVDYASWTDQPDNSNVLVCESAGGTSTPTRETTRSPRRHAPPRMPSSAAEKFE